MKYIDSEKLIAEVKFAKSVYSNPYRVIHGIADGFRQDGRAAMCDDILTKIASLQQEQPEVDLEKELEKWRHDHFKGKRDGDYNGEYLERESQLDLARHFYELGQRTKYQQDRGEFAKLKAKEWQEGYDEGYAKGLNAEKED